MRYINWCFTFLLTYLLTYDDHVIRDTCSDLKGQRSNVKVITSRRQSDACLPSTTRQRKVAEAAKLAERLRPWYVWHSATVSRSEGQRSRSPSRTTLWPKISNLFGTGRPSNLVHGWRRLTRIADVGGDLQAESSGCLFKSPLAGGGGVLWRRHCRPNSLLLLIYFFQFVGL